MQQIWITQAGKPEVLKIKQAHDPPPQKGEVLVGVQSAGINFADIMARMGLYQDAPKIPCVVGYEVSGVIEKVGEGVREFEEGQKVMAMTRFGGYSSKVAVPADQVYLIPSNWDFNLAAAFPVIYITAYQLLVVMGSLREGASVLIHSAGGGVGIAATQIAKIFNATVYGTASAWKHDYLLNHGVDHCIDYREKDFVKEINDISGERGVDIVLDPIGGKNWKKSYQILSPTGRLLMYGASQMAPEKRKSILSVLKTLIGMPIFTFQPVKLISQNKGVLGVNLGHLWNERERVKQWINQLLEWAEKGHIQPHVDKVFSFENAADAHHYIQDRKNLGKVCLEP